MDLYIEINIYPSILFSPSPFKGTFAIFLQGYFIMSPPPLPSLWKFRKKLTLCLFDPLLQLSTKE